MGSFGKSSSASSKRTFRTGRRIIQNSLFWSLFPLRLFRNYVILCKTGIIIRKEGIEMHEEHLYTHDHGDGVIHSHSAEMPQQDLPAHEHTHPHSHTHPHTQTKAVLNRLARAIGHLEHVRKMVEDGQDCTDVLIQLAAVRSALSSTAKIILKDHIEHCVTGANAGDAESLSALNDAINKYI